MDDRWYLVIAILIGVIGLFALYYLKEDRYEKKSTDYQITIYFYGTIVMLIIVVIGLILSFF